MLPEGQLNIQITERRPLFKLYSKPAFYSDANGVLFSFKVKDSMKYPKFQTISSTISLETTASMIQDLSLDSFISSELVHVVLEKDQYQLKLKSFDFDIIFGAPINIDEKIKKLKIFCAYQKIQDSLNGYKKINLSYQNQVVAIMP